MARYSFSQVGTYTQCPLKYRYRYVDRIKIEDFVETADIVLGKIVHSTLEKLYNDVNNFKKASLEELLDFYVKLWQEAEDEAAKIGSEIVIKSDATLDEYKRRGQNYIQHYFEKQSPFDEIKVIDTELDFTFELDEDINFKCIIDRLDKIGNSFVINDYKTNKKLPPQDKENLMEQLTMYGIGIQQKYGKYFENMRARLYLLHFDMEDEWELTQEKLDAVKEKYLGIIKDIEKKKGSYELGNKKVFEPVQSGLCNYCDYQMMCPLFSYVNDDDEVVSGLSEKTISSLVDEFNEIKTKMSELKQQEEALKEIFLQYAEIKDPEDFKPNLRLSGSSSDLTISKSPKFTILEKEEFIQKLKDLGLYEKYADVAYYAVNKIFKDELQIENFEGIAKEDTSFTIRKVAKRKKK